MQFKDNDKKDQKGQNELKRPLSQLILSVNMRDMNPQRLALEVLDSVKIYGVGQLDLLLTSNIIARHIKAKISHIAMVLEEDNINFRYGFDDASARKTDEMLNTYKAAPIVFSNYESVQKYANSAESALSAWIQVESALTLKNNLEIIESALLEYVGIEKEEVQHKIEIQEELILLYGQRICKIRSDENEIAHRWLDKFDGKLYREIERAFMISKKMIETPAQYREFEFYSLKKRLSEETREIEGNRELKGR